MNSLGKRIAIIGVSASGKSVFSRELGERTNIPVTYVDALMWKPGWNYIGDETTVSKLIEISQKPEWIIEGYIEKEARPAVFENADSIVYLDYPRRVAVWRYIKRWWKHRKDARPELEGSPDRFSFKFLKLVWTKGEAISLERFLAGLSNQGKIIKLTSPRQAKIFLDKI
jgi:adenylate kinase family enzyme